MTARTSLRGAATLVILLGTILSAAARQSFDHYRVILQRQPFGKLERPKPPPKKRPPVVVIPAAPQPTPQWVSTLKLFAIEKKKSGTIKVGLMDTKEKRTYFISVGEADDFYVIEADYSGGKALIEKEGREYWYSLDGTYYENGTDPTNAVTGRAAVAAPRSSGSKVLRPSGGGAGMSRAEFQRRRERLASRRKATYVKKTEPPKMKGAELEQHLIDYQMDLIRAGESKGPPLPIPLTEGMDQQLVNEGVLPPRE